MRILLVEDEIKVAKEGLRTESMPAIGTPARSAVGLPHASRRVRHNRAELELLFGFCRRMADLQARSRLNVIANFEVGLTPSNAHQ